MNVAGLISPKAATILFRKESCLISACVNPDGSCLELNTGMQCFEQKETVN